MDPHATLQYLTAASCCAATAALVLLLAPRLPQGEMRGGSRGPHDLAGRARSWPCYAACRRLRAPAKGPVNLQHADLRCADLRGAVLVGAKLAGAFYDASTRWPRGFDPRRRGAKWVGQRFRP